jgi:hypothetical protein
MKSDRIMTVRIPLNYFYLSLTYRKSSPKNFKKTLKQKYGFYNTIQVLFMKNSIFLNFPLFIFEITLKTK